MFFYETDGRSGIDNNSIPKHAIWVENSIVQAVPEHPKKDFVFCLSNSLGDAFLFQVRECLNVMWSVNKSKLSHRHVLSWPICTLFSFLSCSFKVWCAFIIITESTQEQQGAFYFECQWLVCCLTSDLCPSHADLQPDRAGELDHSHPFGMCHCRRPPASQRGHSAPASRRNQETGAEDWHGREDEENGGHAAVCCYWHQEEEDDLGSSRLYSPFWLQLVSLWVVRQLCEILGSIILTGRVWKCDGLFEEVGEVIFWAALCLIFPEYNTYFYFQ